MKMSKHDKGTPLPKIVQCNGGSAAKRDDIFFLCHVISVSIWVNVHENNKQQQVPSSCWLVAELEEQGRLLCACVGCKLSPKLSCRGPVNKNQQQDSKMDSRRTCCDNNPTVGGLYRSLSDHR